MKKLAIVLFLLLFSTSVFAIDFGDGTSKTLTSKAWNALQIKDYKSAIAYANKCVKTYKKKALEQQSSLTKFPPKEEANNFWALNDVATCLFIKGKALREQGKLKKAKKVFKTIIKNYPFAQCYDPHGWFWKVADAAKDQILGIEKGVDFGNYTSETLAKKGWEALNAGEYDKAIIYADKCVELFNKQAKEMQKSLKDFAPKEKAFDYWALNDVATCLFIKGKALKALGKKKEAKKVFKDIIKNYRYAQCWDPNGWFWKVAEGAQSELTSLETGVDFGNCSSETLTGKAWSALSEGKYKNVEIYVKKCLELYGKKAKEMQAELAKKRSFAPKGKEFDYWALNDVATCLFILGKAYYEQGKNKKAEQVFQDIIDNYSYAQCYDPQGWFWKVADAAKDQILLMKTGIDFGDYTSCTLTTKAWQALDAGNLDECLIYCRKCIQLYRKEAEKMQANLDGYLPKEKAFDAWALNDVGTCYFIMGEAYSKKKEWKKALKAYKTLVDKFFYAQCWDPRGWFWKPAVAARGKINKIMAEHGGF